MKNLNEKKIAKIAAFGAVLVFALITGAQSFLQGSTFWQNSLALAALCVIFIYAELSED